jgi:hypothetical protein
MQSKTLSLPRIINKTYYHRKHGHSNFNENGVDIFDEDWDNLIILDACRYDMFKKYNHIPGELEQKISRGSTSKEFIRGNFSERKLTDTVYLSDNSYLLGLSDEYGLNVELHDFRLMKGDSHSKLVTHPRTVTDTAIEYLKKHSNKRTITHYLQPHQPFFSEEGDELFGYDSRIPAFSDFTPEEIRQAYTSSLKLVLSEVQRLVDRIKGKTVITSDHGELFGERMFPVPARRYGHPEGVYIDKLVKVPWFTVDYDQRKNIIGGSNTNIRNRDVDADAVTSRLEGLGYI